MDHGFIAASLGSLGWLTLSFLMRSSMAWISVLASSLRCCSNSSSAWSSQVHMLLRSELNCCHCCRFCFMRSSLLRACACSSSQRSITPIGQRQKGTVLQKPLSNKCTYINMCHSNRTAQQTAICQII